MDKNKNRLVTQSKGCSKGSVHSGLAWWCLASHVFLHKLHFYINSLNLFCNVGIKCTYIKEFCEAYLGVNKNETK